MRMVVFALETGISEYISNGYCDGEISIGCFRHDSYWLPGNGQLFFLESVDGVKLEVVLCGKAVYTIFMGLNKRKHIKCRQINNNVENSFSMWHFVFMRCLIQSSIYKKRSAERRIL